MSEWPEVRSSAESLSKEDLDLMMNKLSDYSPDDLHAAGDDGITSRLYDKIYRLRNLIRGRESKVTDESIEDTLRDIRNYCTILTLKRDGKWPRSVGSVYLAGPIDDSDSSPPDDVYHLLEKRGITVFDPRSAYRSAQVSPSFVARMNRFAISECDAVFVVWHRDCPSLGTGRDVEHARLLGKRVVVYAPWCTSIELQDCENYASLEDAVQALAPEEQ